MSRVTEAAAPFLAAVVLVCSDPVQAGGPRNEPLRLARGYEASGCLSKREAIAAVQSGRARPLAEIRDAAQDSAGGDMIDAQLCAQEDRLAYLITILQPQGKVVSVTVDAVSGRVLGTR